MSRFLPQGYELPFVVQGQRQAVVLACLGGRWTASVQLQTNGKTAKDAADLLVKVLRDLADVVEKEAADLG